MHRTNFMKKRILLTTAVLVLLAAAILPVFADEGDGYKGDFDYNGVVDSESGYGGQDQSSLDGRVRVTSAMLYDKTRSMFVFPLSGGEEVQCSAADGMIVTDAVTLRTTGASALHVYRNGALIELDSAGEIRDTGEYVVYAGQDSGNKVCSFTVIGSAASIVHNYSMPDGFVVREATLEGHVTDYSRYYVDMEQEGRYRIDYSCTSTGRDYSLITQIDRTPPKLVLNGTVGRDGRVHSAVSFSGLEPDDTLRVELDGNPISVKIVNGSGKLTSSGVYHVTATDKAGNTVSREFTIMVYLDSNGVMFILLVIAAIAAVAGYALYKRRTLKIR